jgi:hypothetical protein
VAIQKAFELESDYHLVLNPVFFWGARTLEKLCEFMVQFECGTCDA